MATSLTALAILQSQREQLLGKQVPREALCAAVGSTAHSVLVWA